MAGFVFVQTCLASVDSADMIQSSDFYLEQAMLTQNCRIGFLDSRGQVRIFGVHRYSLEPIFESQNMSQECHTLDMLQDSIHPPKQALLTLKSPDNATLEVIIEGNYINPDNVTLAGYDNCVCVLIVQIFTLEPNLEPSDMAQSGHYEDKSQGLGKPS